MARIPAINRKSDVPVEHQGAWDAIAQSRGDVVGPFTMLLHKPAIARRIADLGTLVRFHSSLPAADRELAILTTACALDCRFEWSAHAPEARNAGVREDAINAVRDGRAPSGLTASEAQIVRYVTALLRDHRVDNATFAAVRDRLGVPGTVELTATVGYYSMLAATLNAFDVAPPAGADDLPSAPR